MVTAYQEETLTLPPQHAGNPYLTGPFAPVLNQDIFTDLEVIGEIPRDLHGTYYRNGPNPKYVPKGRYHWFDGDGMLHALSFEDGKAVYRNRWIETEGLVAEDAERRSLFTGLIEPDPKNPLGYIKDNANTDVIYHKGNLLTLFYRAGKPYVVDPHTLKTIGATDFGGKWKGLVSAHAKVDEHTGELMIFDYGPKPPYMHYGVVSPEGELVNRTPIPLPGWRLPHDIAITRQYTVLMDMPVFVDPEAVKHGKQRIDFFPEIPTRFAVIPRHGGEADIRWFEAEPCYIYHVVNAWDNGDEVVMDVCRVSQPVAERGARMSDLDRMKKVLAEALQSARYHRYRFNLKTGATHEEQLWDITSEFPMVDLNRMGTPTRYSYHVTLPPLDTLRFDGLVKYDTQTGAQEEYKFGPGRWGSEAPFAARTDAVSEDDGYLLSFLHDENSGRSECLILDAVKLTEGPLARVMLPRRVPLGFHATWIPGLTLDNEVSS
ncbi:MAG: carotenoid oxygenase family protein [Acidobacteriota bacterium]|nr:carotenoid oxygenase family protein [Acidobacteriota bacterium]